MNLLVQLDTNSHAFTTTLIIAEGTGVEHRAVRQLVSTHIEHFQDLHENSKAFQMFNLKGKNRPTTYYKLSELQATFLVTLMKNSKIVIEFKKLLSKEFFRIRKELSRIATQQENKQWIEQRDRRIETDVIKEFIDYAKAQGGSEKGCRLYYSNISKMENKALFIVERQYPNLRDILGITDLSTIQKADIIVSRALRDGMNDKKTYKDIYKMAKDRVYLFAELIGKTPLALLER